MFCGSFLWACVATTRVVAVLSLGLLLSRWMCAPLPLFRPWRVVIGAPQAQWSVRKRVRRQAGDSMRGLRGGHGARGRALRELVQVVQQWRDGDRRRRETVGAGMERE